MEVVGALAAVALEGRLGLGHHGGHLGRVGAVGAWCRPCGELGRRHAGPAAEHEEVRQRVAPEPVGPVHAPGHLARGEQPGHRRLLGLGVDAHPAHHVVAGGAHLHGLRR